MAEIAIAKILTIEDEDLVRRVIINYLTHIGYSVRDAPNGRIGLEKFREDRPDLVLVDLRMPEMDGFGVLSTLKKESPETPVIVVSGTETINEAVASLRIGAWDFVSKPIQDMEILRHTIGRALERAHLLKQQQEHQDYIESEIVRRTAQLQQRTREVESTNEKLKQEITSRIKAEEALRNSLDITRKAMEGTVHVLSVVGEFRDPYTAGHQRRVARLARSIGQEMNLNSEQLSAVYLAGLVHDIGKIAIPIEILCKPGRITDVEFSIIKTHPQIGYDILKTVEFPWPIARIVLQHQEHVDGTGYPAGLRSEDILIEARILCVADVVESIGSHRPYRPTLGIDKALDEITVNKGIKYDESVCDACLMLFHEHRFAFDDATPTLLSIARAG